MPLFSIIIPTKNRSLLLKIAIESVLNQKYQDFELIVIDDHSDDNTNEVVRAFNDSRITYTLNKSIERSAARNTGIDIAQGDYICFLDDDDYYTENYLLDFYNYLQGHDFPKDVILRTGFIKKYENGKENKSAMYDEWKHKDAVRFAAYNMCGLVCLCIPKNALANERFDERYYLWEDTHLILRLFNSINLIQLSCFNYIYNLCNRKDYATNIMENCKNNIECIKDYFVNHDTKNRSTMKSFLLAEKYIQYSLLTNIKYEKSILQKKSIEIGFYLSLWKYYLKSYFL